MQFLFEFLGFSESPPEVGDGFFAGERHGCGDGCVGAVASSYGIGVVVHLEADCAVFAAICIAEHVGCAGGFGVRGSVFIFVVAG